MTKIREIVQINGGYTSVVDLYEDYYELEKNQARMRNYKPIAAHRQAFEKIANALNPLDRRFYFLSGSYGTGKSHLLLMLANYFANQSDLPEMVSFFNNYETSQNDVLIRPGEVFKERRAASLKEARKSGRYLVAICRYSLNLDFEGAILRALEHALQKDDSTILFSSHYQEALRRVKEWKSRQNKDRFFSELQAALTEYYSDWTIDDLVDGLQKYDEKALSAFKRCFRKVTDSDFSYDKDNLRDIISDFLKNPVFKQRYKGIVLLYDEFGAAIDEGFVKYHTLLDFAQYCTSSSIDSGGPVIFVGAGHKTFVKHGSLGDYNAETLAARVTEIGLQTQGMEDIISAIVQPKKESPDWEKEVKPQRGKFINFTVDCNRLRLFNWLDAKLIGNNIIENIYPMHPLATFALLRLASEAGSDNRSVFRFFAPEFETGEQGWTNVEPYSYPWFIENNEILDQGKLSLYTPDLLVDYFKDSLKVENNRLVVQVKNHISNYEATIHELNGYLARQNMDRLFDEADELMRRILKTMLVNEITSTQEVSIPNTAQNIEFALDFVSSEERQQIENRLKLLTDANVLFNNGGVYELVPGDRKDVRRMVDQFKNNPENKPTNLLTHFLRVINLRGDDLYLDARDYNANYSEDKRLRVVFSTPPTLTENINIDGKNISFFENQELERLQTRRGSSAYEGVAVYVLCENENDIDAAKSAVTRNDQARVVVAIPRTPTSVYDAIFTLKALDSDLFREQAKSFSPFEAADEQTIREEANKLLKSAKESYFNNAKVNWFGLRGSEIPVQDSKRYDVANKVILDLYENKRNTFGHIDFNKSHQNITGNLRSILKEAGDLLIDLSQPVSVNWSWADNRGGTKYLRKCFVDHQALRVTAIEGDVRHLESEKDIAKFRASFPAYAELLNELSDLKQKGPKNLNTLLEPIFEEFGQGELAATLMLLLARRFFGDGLRFKRDLSNLADIQFSSTDEMLSLVQGQNGQTVVLLEPVSAEEKAFFAKVTQTFSDQSTPAGKVYTINEAFESLVRWWTNLPIIARSSTFHTGERKVLAELFSQAKTRDPFRFIKYDLLSALGHEPGVALTEDIVRQTETNLKDFKDRTEGIEHDVENQVLALVADLFGLSSTLDVDIQDAFKAWHRSLRESQKDQYGLWHNNDSKPLVKNTAYTDIRTLLFETLPEAYSLGKISNWATNNASILVQRIQAGMNHIEDSGPNVEPPIIEYENALSKFKDQVTYQSELVVHAKTTEKLGVIYYTEDGSDPATSNTRLKLDPGDSIVVTGNRKIRLAVADEKGNYSAIQTIDAIDELNKHRIVRTENLTVLDETISFVFPKNKESARITISSLFSALDNSEIYSDDELQNEVLRILDELGQ